MRNKKFKIKEFLVGVNTEYAVYVKRSVMANTNFRWRNVFVTTDQDIETAKAYVNNITGVETFELIP